MNILITSAGQRGYIFEHFKETAKGRYGIYGADVNKYAPALQNADKAFLMPYASDPRYLEALIKLCKENDIKGILSLNDNELPRLAEYREELRRHGINAVISDKAVVDMTWDKYLTYQFCKEHDIATPRTYLWSEKEQLLADLDSGLMCFPVLAKPRKGSKSIGIHKLYSKSELIADMDQMAQSPLPEDEKCIYQEFVDSFLYSTHTLCDKEHRPVSIVAMHTLIKHLGETYQNISFRDEALYRFTEHAIRAMNAYGIVDMNINRRANGEYVLLEFNTRISGGYSLSHFAQPSFTQTLLDITLDKEVPYDPDAVFDFKDGVVMFKQFITSFSSDPEIDERMNHYTPECL